MATIYYQDRCSLDALKGQTIAVVGYGSQGRAQALNLRDSGLEVVIGLREGSRSRGRAEQDGMKVLSVAQASGRADVVILLAGDPAQKSIYETQVRPNLGPGKALAFSHGFNIHFGQIVPEASTDVFMVAPKGPGHMVRSQYEAGCGVPCLVAVHQDASGRALAKALAYAAAIGGARAGVIETTFAEETETDLFGEQTVLCGGVSELIKAGFETLAGAGYQPEVAYFECLHELKLIVDLIYQGGLTRMRQCVSDTAEFGDYVSGSRVVGPEARAAMARILAEIRDGSFAARWIAENEAGRPFLLARRDQEASHPVEKVGRGLRRMMSWIGAVDSVRPADKEKPPCPTTS